MVMRQGPIILQMKELSKILLNLLVYGPTIRIVHEFMFASCICES